MTAFQLMNKLFPPKLVIVNLAKPKMGQRPTKKNLKLKIVKGGEMLMSKGARTTTSREGQGSTKGVVTKRTYK